MANGYNAINDRIEIVNWLLASGEISGDIDIEPLTITENGEYVPGAGKAFGRVVVSTPIAPSYDVTMTMDMNISKITQSTVRSFTESAQLTNVQINCITIGESAFQGYTLLTSAKFPVCSIIESRAFRGCGSLSDISFPSCTTIGQSVFEGCSSLSDISFPACTVIEPNAFIGCNSLNSLSFPACSIIGDGAFSTCKNLTAVNFPSCKTIGQRAFSGCINLATASFPECSTIYSFAFSACYNLVSLYLTGSYLCNLISADAFSSTPIGGYSASAGQFGSIYVPASLIDQYKTASNWSWFSSRFTEYTQP